MKICLIHGSNRKGNTDKTLEIVKDELNKFESGIEYTDIFLPRDLPEFCRGCFACIIDGQYGGEKCPHIKYTEPIKNKLLEADGIVLGCPCYAMAETAQVKALFDHFACTYLFHRPNAEMFSKIALVVSTAAGAGTGRTVSTISRNFMFWGIKRIVKCRLNLWQSEWNKISQKRKNSLDKKIRRSAGKFYKLTRSRERIRPSVSVTAVKKAAKIMVSSLIANKADTDYWVKNGWLKK